MSQQLATQPLIAADWLTYGTQFLRRHAAATPQLDARLLLAHVLGETVLMPERTAVSPAASEQFEAFLARRAKGEPVSRILGKRDFWKFSFDLSPETLDPRPDSEILVEAALAFLSQDKPVSVLDLGTGSGALLLSVLAERPNAQGLGTDCAPAALAQARKNARKLGLLERSTFINTNWGEGIKQQFTLILANPPYIPTEELSALAPEVRCFDPQIALDGGADGLTAYRAIAPALPRLLAPKGRIILEAGDGQAKAIKSLLASAGLKHYDSRNDLGGCPRALCFGHFED